MPLFGQIIIGPPGAGKSTYCNAMRQFLECLPRPVACINLDPANDRVPYTCDVDVFELININDVMQNMNLGPNGGLVFCMEYIESKLDWLRSKFEQLEKTNGRYYVLIDFPGQVELYTHHTAVKTILHALGEWGHRFVAVHLADSHYCVDPFKFISVLLTSLNAMINLEMPHINLLSKCDLIHEYGELPLPLEFFTDVMDMKYLLQKLKDDPFGSKFNKLNEAIVSVVEDYSLVTFSLLNISDSESMLAVLKLCDQANGYVYYETDAPDLRNIKNKSMMKDPVDMFRQVAKERYE